MNSVSRRALAVVLSGALVGLPLFAASPRVHGGTLQTATPLGFVDSAVGAELSGVRAVAGSTVFSGDSVRVRPGGRLGVTLTGGSRAFFAPGADASVVQKGAGAIVSLRSGEALLSTQGGRVEGTVADVIFRPAGHTPSSGWLSVDGNGRMTLYADKGDWLVTTAGGRTSVVLRQGNRLEGSLSSSAQGSGQADRKKRKKKLAAFWISTGAVGLGAGLALAYEGSNPVYCVDPPGQMVCGRGPVVSPVLP